MVNRKTALAITASIRFSQVLVNCKPPLLNLSILIAKKTMKSSTLTLGLGIIAAAGSVMIGASAEAATLLFADGPLSLTSKQFEFEFLPPTKGDFRSKLFVASTDKSSYFQTLFTEPFSNDGTVTPNGVVASTANWAATDDSFIVGWGRAYLSENNPILGVPDYAVYSNGTFPVDVPYFQLLSVDNGWYTFAIEDIVGGGDGDFNDGKFRVRAVPVPAIVPGIALAGAFFGSKALKRNKKKAEESVA